jgi:GNAT superfamily N-acetyltransferase
MRDVLGTLEAVDAAGHLTVRRRDGSTERIPLERVVTAKVVPSSTSRLRRARDIGVAELELVAAAGWQPLERSSLGDWMLRAAGGFTGRANSVLPLGEPGRDLDEALRTVVAWYAERGLPARFQLPLPFTAQLDAALASRGWASYNPTHVLVADLEPVRMTIVDDAGLPPVDLTDAPDAAWLQTYSYRGQELPQQAREVMIRARQPVFASVRDRGDLASGTVAVARAAIDAPWVGITAVDVVESTRRRGLATHVMKVLFDHAARNGARHAYLQVAEENLPARAMYDKLGFVTHHTYHYRVAD